MRILVLNADYPRFLAWFYRRQPGLGSAPYATQMAALCSKGPEYHNLDVQLTTP